jgi:acyl-CoA thioesterase I
VNRVAQEWRRRIVASPQQIVVLGDSLAISPSRESNFAVELQARLARTHPAWIVVNHGIRGDTTSGGLRRVEYALGGNARVMILELGANDGLRGVDAQTIEKNLARLIQFAEARDVRVLLCGMETPPLRGWSYSHAFHDIYPRLAARHTVSLVPFLLEGVAFRGDLNHDGIHPNTAGAKMIAENVWPHLERLLAGLKTRPTAEPNRV